MAELDHGAPGRYARAVSYDLDISALPTPADFAEQLSCSVREIHEVIARKGLLELRRALGVGRLRMRTTPEDNVAIFLIKSGGMSAREVYDAWMAGDTEDTAEGWSLFMDAELVIDQGYGDATAAPAE